MDISKNIQKIRQEKGITQSQVAEAIGMERTNYFRIEKRGNKLSVEQLEKIAGALGVSVVDLMTGEPGKVEDVGKVRELEKKIESLEKWLKDKETIIDTFNHRHLQNNENLMVWFTRDFFQLHAIAFGIGAIDIIHVKSKKVLQTFLIKDIKTGINLEYEEPGEGAVEIRFKFSTDERRNIIQRILATGHTHLFVNLILEYKLLDTDDYDWFYQVYFGKKTEGDEKVKPSKTTTWSYHLADYASTKKDVIAYFMRLTENIVGRLMWQIEG